MILKNLSEKEYNEIPAIRSTLLNTIDKKTMAHAKAQMDGITEPTAAMILGTAAHDYLLRPEIFQKTWGVFSENYNGTTTAGKAEKAALLTSFAPDRLIKHDQVEMFKAWTANLKATGLTAKILENITDTELSLAWHEDGLDCKARIDAVAKIGDLTLLIDFKSAASASQSDFEKSCINYGYLIQSSHYLAGAKACGVVEKNNNNFIHIVLEKEAPYLVASYCLDDASLEIGDIRRYKAMQKYRLALESGVWPGYSDKIETIAMPHWYIQQQNDTEQVATFN